MDQPPWIESFRAAYTRAKAAYQNGADSLSTCVSAADGDFLATLGSSAQELFDLVEDDVTMGEPGLEMAIRITRVRWEYFQTVGRGRGPERRMALGEIPAAGVTLGGIAWLPRILAKARARLRGELPSELMYSCGGDRQFLKAHGLEADAFLRAVWEAGDRDEAILEYVRQRGPG